jgi:hypothetical protein
VDLWLDFYVQADGYDNLHKVIWALFSSVPIVLLEPVINPNQTLIKIRAS